ncbi:hypothetical protein JB92DRAFT_2941146 [Gautieria morchelliformis]|nr:hypothetical protein JB92DRAFT_2941146 [Gautieria morchelliformis]
MNIPFRDILPVADTLQRCPYVFPIVGERKIPHLLDSIKALSDNALRRTGLVCGINQCSRAATELGFWRG